MAKKEGWNDTRKKPKQLGPTIETLLEMVESDWDAFVQVLREERMSKRRLDRLVPAIWARPELCERLLEAHSEAASETAGSKARSNIRTIEQWFPRQVIKKDGRYSFGQIALSLAREHDPVFPDMVFTSPLAKWTTRNTGLSKRERRGEFIQDGRGWRYFGYTKDTWLEMGEESEATATAIHPEWTLTVHHHESDGALVEFWYTFDAWGKVPKREVNVEGMAQVKRALGPVLTGRLVVGRIAPEHGVRLLRDRKVRWQGKFEKLSPIKGEELPLEEGRSFMARLDVPFRIKVADTLECFTEQVEP